MRTHASLAYVRMPLGSTRRMLQGIVVISLWFDGLQSQGRVYLHT
jgi:hypothetical protein